MPLCHHTQEHNRQPFAMTKQLFEIGSLTTFLRTPSVSKTDNTIGIDIPL
jgi:hypothetical protein